jgi:hypothetical protein
VRICRSGRNFFTAALLFTLGCGQQPSRKETARALENLQSWMATAQLAAASWQAGSIPKPYTVDTLGLARKQIHEENEKLRSAALPSDLRSQLIHSSEGIEQIVHRLDSAVQQGNASAVAQQSHQLVAEEQSFTALLGHARVLLR